MKTISNCCTAKVILGDICSDCKEHCEVIDVCECSRCKHEAYSDTWVKSEEGELFCEDCALRIKEKMESPEYICEQAQDWEDFKGDCAHDAARDNDY